MADLNALIAQGAQFAAPVDPFAQYGKMQQLEQASSTNQLNRMKMDEYQRGLQEQNALRGLDPAAADYLTQVKKVNPKLGFEFGKLMQEGDKEQALTLKAKNEALKFSLDNSRSFLVGVNDQPAYDAWRAYSVKNVPELEKMLPLVFTPEAKDGLLKTADDISKRLTAAPPAPPASVAEFTFAKTPEGGSFKGSYQDFVTAKAVATRAPATPSAPVAVIGPNGEEIFVSREEALSKRMTPASGARLKPIPTQINQAIIKNVQTLKQLDDTIALLGKNPDATGYKGYLPNVVLSRMDPEGVDVRAGIADIGSLVLHERSGAAVTAAESPRLLPFIPLATDDNATAVKKLKRMREIAAADQLGLTETYGQDQGYKPNPLVSKPAAAPEAAPAIPTIYATNGKQRLQSTDGGKNWTPVK
jgi:hypothetical protein